MNTQFYAITTKSNTHVGSGQNSYGIVDNVVQRDYLYELPCINGTSLKGALREYAEHIKCSNIEGIFGSKPNEEVANNLKQGTHYFHQAYLISFPMRSNNMQFFNATCPKLLQQVKNSLPENHSLIKEINDLLDKNEVRNITLNNPISATHNDAIIEKHSITTTKIENVFSDEIKKLIGDNPLLMHDNTFKQLVKKLPIITRNQLENGQSANLFYEEVVPRETRFGFKIQASGIDSYFDTIADIQIGANATVGYGFCSLTKI